MRLYLATYNYDQTTKLTINIEISMVLMKLLDNFYHMIDFLQK